MDEIAAFCESRGFALVEDCAQSLGARFAGRATGAFGIGCFSLHPLKVLSACGDAGFVTVASDEAAALLRRLRNIGLRDRDHCSEVAGNSRLDTLQAALLLVKLAHFDDYVAARRAHVAAYLSGLAGRVTLPPAEDDRHEAIWSAFVIRHPQRDRLRDLLAAAGIESKIHYPVPIHRQEAFADLAPFPPLPETDRTVATMLSLPVTPELPSADRARVIAAVHEAVATIGSAA
jgi:dTDP-4-amino-4,6-dideoxygalactose transaminase